MQPSTANRNNGRVVGTADSTERLRKIQSGMKTEVLKELSRRGGKTVAEEAEDFNRKSRSAD